MATTCSSVGHGSYCGWFSVATIFSPRVSACCVARSRSEPNCANASSSRYWARSRRRRPATFRVGELARALEEPRVQVEDVAGERLAARRAAQQQRELPVGVGVLREVVVHDERVLTLVQEVLAH